MFCECYIVFKFIYLFIYLIYFNELLGRRTIFKKTDAMFDFDFSRSFSRLGFQIDSVVLIFYYTDKEVDFCVLMCR